MSGSKKLALGALTAWPIAYMFVFAAFFVAAWNSTGDEPPGFAALLILHLLTMVICLGLVAFYVVHVYRSKRVPDDRRVLWTVLLLLVSIPAMAVYFYLYVWRDAERHTDQRSMRSATTT